MSADREAALVRQVELLAAALGVPVVDPTAVIAPVVVAAATEAPDVVKAVRAIRRLQPGGLSLLQGKLLADAIRRDPPSAKKVVDQ